MIPTHLHPRLPVARYRLRFAVDGGDPARGYLGSAWRGALGHALRKTVCVTRQRDCPSCLLYRSCVYPYLFDTPPPVDSDRMRKYTAVPHPYILQLPFPGEVAEVESEEQERDEVLLGLVLVGRATTQLPYLIHALTRAGIEGVGSGRRAYSLQSVEQSERPDEKGWTPIYEPQGELRAQEERLPTPPPIPARIRVELLTPFRTKREGSLINADSFDFRAFFSPLMRRIAMLQYFHAEQGDLAEPVDFRTLTEEARAVELPAVRLQWRDWIRYSSRQKKKMQMGGVVGHFILEGKVAVPFWHWLWLGQWVHNGKATTMGLGRYRIMADAE